MLHKRLFLQLILSLTASVLAISGWSADAETGQRTFATPREAAKALLSVAEKDDVAMLSKIFGMDADEILNSGDPVQDKANRVRFVERAKQSLQVKTNRANPNQATLLIGSDRFPFPIPLVKTQGRWHFDTPAGKKEILARRIGSNELDAIAACKAYVDAQYDYAGEDRNKNGVPEYARRLISSPGKRDGLFWPGADIPPTQFAEKVQKAGAEGYKKEEAKSIPYHGYYYKILTGQGTNARGGALEYIQHGLMIGGFALVAWPAQYGVSGIKTFIVNQSGVIYEKDLGASTEAAAGSMAIFNPDKTWRRAG